MFKKTLVAVMIAAALFAATPMQAGHIGCYTNYVQNGSFSNSGSWNYVNSAYRETSIDDPCDIYYGWTMNAAALKNANDAINQSFTTDTHTAIGWTMNLEIQTTSISGATAWDEVRILVENLTTGQSEVFFIKGNQLTSTCQRFDFTLTKNYSNSNVKISINSQAFSSLDFYIDNVAFFGQYC